jgi:hypothetical protein
LERLLSSGVREAEYKSAVDPHYDVLALRRKETSRRHVSG